MQFNLPKNIDFVLETLINNGYKAYIVGGCVRDLLCGKLPHDYDITTSATPPQIQLLFKKTINTGIKHGTVTVVIDGEMIEVTTFRTETEYIDNRHPDRVNFVADVKSDLSRRDFTVNAMCYNHTEGLIDCFGGVADIKSKLLRAVGHAKLRFGEDALRILRLFRFSSTLDFQIEGSTLDAALECAPLLNNISAERIFAELQKAAFGKLPNALYPLLCTGCLAAYYLKQSDLSGITGLGDNINLRTFALLNLCSTDLSKTLTLLKCSNDFKDYCNKMQYLVKNAVAPNKISIKHALNFADADILKSALLYYQHILKENVDKHYILLDETLKAQEPYKISQLDISGNDIIALGFEGEAVGKKLEQLLDKVIKNPKLNNRETLINLICN